MEEKNIRKSLFDGEYSSILKSLSFGNTYLANTSIESYLKDFNGVRRLNAIDIFVCGTERFEYEDNGSVLLSIKELLFDNKSDLIDNREFLFTSNDALIYGDFVRFMFALYFGNYDREVKKIVDKVYSVVAVFTEGVIESYKKENEKVKKISFLIAASIYRNILESLFDFSNILGDLNSKADIMYYKTFITCNIMADYRALIGPDMIKTAVCYEEVSRIDEAKKMYEAIIGDFECILVGDYKEEEREEDYISLVSLWQAYGALNRIENINKYSNKMELAEKIIKKIKS